MEWEEVIWRRLRRGVMTATGRWSDMEWGGGSEGREGEGKEAVSEEELRRRPRAGDGVVGGGSNRERKI